MENRKPSLPKVAIGTRPNTKKESPMPLEQMIGREIIKINRMQIDLTSYRELKLRRFLIQPYDLFPLR